MRLAVILGLSLLCACSATEQGFVDHPEQYGLYVAATNLDMAIPLQIRSDATGEVISIQMRIFGNRDGYGYLEKSLPPGRYHIYSYHPYSNITVPLLTDTGYFDVVAGCFNYGGHIHFGAMDNRAVYTNEVDVSDIENLPKPLAKMAAGKDICMAPTGKANQRVPLHT